MANISSLFKKTKNDPEFLTTQERVRQSHLKTLSRAIKEVQLLSTESGPSGGKVGDCRATQRLCTRFENVLRHGQKARWFGQSSSFWPLVLQISRKQAIEYINSLQYAVTGTGKCRAWIRMAVNECSLESYIGVICQNHSLRSQHYEAHAFMRDEDTVQPLQQLLGGLSQINFNITVDTASLEFEAVPEALQPPLQLRLPHHLTVNRERRRHRKHRHKPSTRSHDSTSRSHDRQVTSIEDSSDDSSSDEQSIDQDDEGEEEEEEEDRMKKKKKGEIHTETGREANVLGDGGGGGGGGGGIYSLDACIATVSGDGDDVMVGECDNKERRAGGVGDGSEASNGGRESERDEKVVAGVSDREREFGDEDGKEEEESCVPTGESVGDQDTVQDTIQDRSQDAVQDAVQDQSQDSMWNTVTEETVTGELSERDGGLEGAEAWTPGASSTAGEEKLLHTAQRYESQTQENEEREYESQTWENEEREYGSQTRENEEREYGSQTRENEEQEYGSQAQESEEQKCGYGSQTGDISSKASLPTPFDHDDTPRTISDRTSKNPFDLLEQNLTSGGTDHGSEVPQVASGRNPFDESPPASPIPSLTTPPLSPPHPLPLSCDDLTTPTPETSHSPHFPPPPPHPSHPHTTTSSTTTTNPFDSAPPPATPSPPSSPTSSNFLGEEVPVSLAHRQLLLVEMGEGGVGVGRGSRADSMEWSVFIEQNMADGTDESPMNDSLQLEEDYYSAEMGIPELQEAILGLKQKLLSSSSSLLLSEQHKLRKSIVQLQLKLQRKKEEDKESQSPHEEICGHRLVRQPRQKRVLSGLQCLACKKKVRGLIREWYRCKTCQSVCHKKCLSSVVTQCSVPGEDVKYVMEVCPEKGLTAQQFRCVRCNRGFALSSTEVRQCDYDGLYYCPDCHTNDTAVIPARVMHNWDFNTRSVCCQCACLLHHLSSRPLLRVDKVNPLLYIHIQDLVEVEALRRDILRMKRYLAECRIAKDLQLLHKLDAFPNFKDHASLLSLHEMVEIQNGSLLPLLKDVHRRFAQHIQKDCQACSKRSYTCSLCSSGEPLYPFGHEVSLCRHCSATYHKNCFSEVSSCPKCRRTKT